MMIAAGFAVLTAFAAAPAFAEGYVGHVTEFVIGTQAELHRLLAVALRAVAGEDPWTSALWLMGLSFLYGIFHAGGPGHGKLVIGTWMLANRTALKKGVLLAFLASLAQATTAVAIVGLVAWAFDWSARETQMQAVRFETVSFALVCMMGLYMIWSGARRLWVLRPPSTKAKSKGEDDRKAPDDHGHEFPAGTESSKGHERHDRGSHHAHAGHENAYHETGDGVCAACGHVHMPDPSQLEGRKTRREWLGIVLSVGIRPCTGAILVLLFSFALNLAAAGIAATYVMALGTTITVSLLAMMAIFSRRLAMEVLRLENRRLMVFEGLLILAGGVVVGLIGFGLMEGAVRASSGGGNPLF